MRRIVVPVVSRATLQPANIDASQRRPKGTRLSRWLAEPFAAVENKINRRQKITPNDSTGSAFSRLC